MSVPHLEVESQYLRALQPAEIIDFQVVSQAAVLHSPAGGLSFIEQLQKTAKLPCSNPPHRWCVGTDEEAKVCLVTRPACKRWSCFECAARNARRWIARVINGVNKLDGDWFMFTVTAHEKCRGTDHSVSNLRQGWKKLYNRAKYHHQTGQYVKVWEMHKDGETFHLHGLVDTNWGQKWLKDNSRSCGMGYQCEVHQVDNAGQVAGYIAKYFLKSEGTLKDGYQWPENLRRIEVSRKWPKLPELADFSRFQWVVLQTEGGADSWSVHKRQAGYRVVDLRGG